MQQLLPLCNTLIFHLRVKIVANESEAFAELQQCQSMYVCNPRAFFSNQGLRDTAQEVVAMLRAYFTAPGLWRDATLIAPSAAGDVDPDPPCLTDLLVFGLLKDSGLLEKRHTAVSIFETLKVLQRIGTAKCTCLCCVWRGGWCVGRCSVGCNVQWRVGSCACSCVF